MSGLMVNQACLKPIVSEVLSALSAKDALSAKGAPYIIGIGGGAGVGKTTFAGLLKALLEKECKKALVIHLDDFFKSLEERQRIGTEWDESHINLALARRVLDEIKHKNTGVNNALVTKPRYNRATGKIESESIDISGIDAVIFEGIYAISSEARLGNFLEFIDLSIFMSAELSDIKKWRFLQEAKKPHPRSMEQMERHWNGILGDLNRNILPAEKNARFIIFVDSEHSFKVSDKRL